MDYVFLCRALIRLYIMHFPAQGIALTPEANGDQAGPNAQALQLNIG
jgi:hypothetical protein